MKSYRLLITITLLLIFGVNLIHAQKEQPQGIHTLTPDERIELRAKTLSNQLMLNDKTSKSFTSIYRKYLKDLHKSTESLDKMLAKQQKKGRGYADYSDKDIEKLLNEELKLNEKKLKIHKKYYNKLKDVLTMRQLFELFEPVFHTPLPSNAPGPLPIENPDEMKPGRIQDADRLPVVPKKEASKSPNTKN